VEKLRMRKRMVLKSPELLKSQYVQVSIMDDEELRGKKERGEP
jgi:hypothetical protein